MSGRVDELIAFVAEFHSRNLGCAKDTVAQATAKRFGLKKVRSLYIGPDLSIRFSLASRSGLSNTILSLSALQPHDSRPLIVGVIRKTSVEFLLANSTFLRKVSHSSRPYKYNQAVRQHNQKVNSAVDAYNRDVRAYNARVRAHRQRVVTQRPSWSSKSSVG